MLLYLLKQLSGQFNIPAAFFYTSTRLMLSFITSLLACLFLGPSFIRALYSLKVGQWVRIDECPHLFKLHEKKQDTPTMGGALMLCAMLFSLVLWNDWSHLAPAIFFCTIVYLGCLGGIDDFLKIQRKNAKGLSSKKKMCGQLIFASILSFYLLFPSYFGWKPEESFLEFRNLYIPFLKHPLSLTGPFFLAFAFFLMVFVIVGSSNAVNLTDGLDGLAAGSLVPVGIAFSLIAFVSSHIELARYLNIPYLDGAGEIAIILASLVGACFGFLWYNSYPAQMFMGDIGSLALGGVIGVAAILLRRELLLAIIGGVFVIEALSVILQVLSYKYRGKKRVFLCAPIHHHFEFKGYPETKVVIRFWIIGFLLAAFGLITLKFQ